MTGRPITGAGGVNSLSVGEPSIRNTALGIVAQGVFSCALGAAVIHTTPSYAFDFVSPNPVYPNRFVFDGAIVQTKAGIGETLQVGNAALKNLAAASYALGINSLRTGNFAIGKHGGVDFELAAPNIHAEIYFHFGAATIKSHAVDCSGLGNARICVANLAIRPVGVPAPLPLAKPALIAHRGALNFAFTEPNIPFSRRFDFGSRYPITKATANDTLMVGDARIVNVAQGMLAGGAPQTILGSPIVAASRAVDFALAQTDSPNNAKNIGFYFGLPNDFVPVGFDGLQIGDVQVRNVIDVIYAIGDDGAVVGQADVIDLDNGSQEIVFGNLVSFSSGRAKIINARQWILPKSVIAFASGNHDVSHFLRYVWQKGNEQLGVGRVWITYGRRYIQAIGVFSNDRASRHLIGFHQRITADGVLDDGYGDATLWRGTPIYADGKATDSHGMAMLDFAVRTIAAKGVFGFADDSQVSHNGVGIATIRNNTHFIYLINDPQDGLSPPKQDGWTSIYNANRLIQPTGAFTQKIGYHQIDNNARIIAPATVSPPVIAEARISHWLQTVSANSVAAGYISTWAVIYNNARVVAIKAINSEAVGLASITINQQTAKVLGSEQSTVGHAMLADRVRAIIIQDYYQSPTIGVPTIKLYTRYINAIGAIAGDKYNNAVGIADIVIHWNIIRASFVPQDKYGMAQIRNTTPELKSYGSNHEEVGSAAIRTQWRNIYTQVGVLTIFGRSVIADRTQQILLTAKDSVSQLAIGLAKITKGVSPPYSLQYIDLRGRQKRDGGVTNGDGVAPPDPQVGVADVRQMTIYALGIKTEQQGAHNIVSNGIKVDVGVYALQVGAASVGLKNRTIIAKGVDHTIVAGMPRFSPHTIYAFIEAPAQARRNHPDVHTHTVDYYLNTAYPPNKIGSPTISNQHRKLRAYTGYFAERVGNANIANRKHYIEPRGVRISKFGIASFPFTPQTIALNKTQDYADIGQAVIEHAPVASVQTIAAVAVVGAIGRAQIQNKHRTLMAIGVDMARLGSSRSNDTPYMWQGLRIGENVPFLLGGFEFSQIGGAWLSHRVRELVAAGYDSFISEYDITNFKGRMTIRRAMSAPLLQAIAVHGRCDTTTGLARIKNHTHYIHPDGNSEVYRQGAGEWM
ncbi:hypothetical protein ACF3N0_08715 [Moraxella atlantae]|uniref:hypothetical protein n=1 Tax=Faucicola atlantae TaxID=34059 RepID=UPI00374FFC07